MQPLQISIGPTIRIGRESWCLPYAGFLNKNLKTFNFFQPLNPLKVRRKIALENHGHILQCFVSFHHP